MSNFPADSVACNNNRGLLLWRQHGARCSLPIFHGNSEFRFARLSGHHLHGDAIALAWTSANLQGLMPLFERVSSDINFRGPPTMFGFVLVFGFFGPTTGCIMFNIGGILPISHLLSQHGRHTWTVYSLVLSDSRPQVPESATEATTSKRGTAWHLMRPLPTKASVTSDSVNLVHAWLRGFVTTVLALPASNQAIDCGSDWWEPAAAPCGTSRGDHRIFRCLHTNAAKVTPLSRNIRGPRLLLRSILT